MSLLSCFVCSLSSVNKHFSLWSTIVLITRGIEHSYSTQTWRLDRSLSGLNDESVDQKTPEAPVSGHHHHDPREVCVEVATVPTKEKRQITKYL